jgi:hypothetical protein
MSQTAAASSTSLTTHIGFTAGHYQSLAVNSSGLNRATQTTINSIAGECSVFLARGISTIGRSVLQDPDASFIGGGALTFD